MLIGEKNRQTDETAIMLESEDIVRNLLSHNIIGYKNIFKEYENYINCNRKERKSLIDVCLCEYTSCQHNSRVVRWKTFWGQMIIHFIL